jgi:hypothetical protein
MTVYIVYSMYIELYMYVHYIIRRHSSMDVDVHVASIIKLLWGRINFSIIIHFVDFIFEANSDSINNCSLLGESSLKIIDSRLHLGSTPHSLTSPYIQMYTPTKDVTHLPLRLFVCRRRWVNEVGRWIRWGGE